MLRSVTLLILLGFIWGSGYSIARYAMLHGVAPLGYAFWQAWGPAIFLFWLSYRRGLLKALPKNFMGYSIVVGVIGIAIPNTNMYFVAAHLPAGILAVIVNIVPLIAYPMALSAGQEQFSRLRLLGVAIGVAGIMLIILPKASLPTAAMVSFAALALLSPFCFAACAIYSSKYRPRHANSIVLSFGMLFSAAVLLTPVVMLTHQFFVPSTSHLSGTFAVILEIILSSIGYIVFFELLKIAGPVYYSLVGGLVGLTGVFWGWVVFDETVTKVTVTAIVLILIAIVLVTAKRKAYVKSSSV